MCAMDSPAQSEFNILEKLALLSTEMELEISKLNTHPLSKSRATGEFEVLKFEANQTVSPELEYVCLLFRLYVKRASDLRDRYLRHNNRSGSDYAVDARNRSEFADIRRGGSTLLILSANMPTCLISLHQQLNKSYPHVIHGLGALTTSLFWLRVVALVVSSIAVILLSQTHLLQVSFITADILSVSI